jgi:hypothetical protein
MDDSGTGYAFIHRQSPCLHAEVPAFAETLCAGVSARRRGLLRRRIKKQIFITLVLAACLTLIFSLFLAEVSNAKTAKEINSEVKSALRLFSQHVKGGKEFLQAAKGVLVVPNIVKAGLGVGGEYGVRGP